MPFKFQLYSKYSNVSLLSWLLRYWASLGDANLATKDWTDG